MRCLLIGASGQLGQALYSAFSPAHQLIGTAYRHGRPGDIVVDLGDCDRTRAVLREVNPDLILIAGAMCDVDRCELEPELCRRINALGPSVVAEYARDNGRRAVFFSTDHIFDGLREMYVEADPTCPLNAYARSKAEGEAALRELLPNSHLIIRTAWLYGPDAGRKNFALRCVDRLRAGETILVPADQWGSPTYTVDLAGATLFLIERGLSGTFHATGPDFVDRVTLARAICACFGLDKDRIIPKFTKELGQAAPRPLRVRLGCHKLRRSGAAEFRGIERGLESLALSMASLVSQ